MAKLIIVQPGQTLENLALQYYGSVDAVVDLVWDNRAILVNGFNSDLAGGEQLSIRDTPYDAVMRAAIIKEQVVPASGRTIPPTVVPDGGDYNNDHNNDHLIS